MARLRFKKSIADAAVDGVVPEGHLRSEAQAYEDLMAWLARLDAGDTRTIVRRAITVPLGEDDPIAVGSRMRRYGDFSRMNLRWNRRNSDATHHSLLANPEEWGQYHTLYRQHRMEWTVVPYEEAIRWCRDRSGYTIGDFGCGEALLAAALRDQHIVHSFDHVAINDDVVACDMAHVPLDDESLDVALFSLSLMGSNFSDYLREVHRVLKLDGHLHVWEATSRFSDIAAFARGLEQLGFRVVTEETAAHFTHLWATKAAARVRADAGDLVF
jgi:hypothetical protein